VKLEDLEITPMMDKEQAMSYLGVKKRTIERYGKRGLLHPEYVKFEHGEKAVYKEEELEALRKQFPLGKRRSKKSQVTSDTEQNDFERYTTVMKNIVEFKDEKYLQEVISMAQAFYESRLRLMSSTDIKS
jgi:predicted site-specific integrase-resolvase